MASSRIKGITIEIGGNTTKLNEALKGVDKQITGLNTDLKGLNQALKLDPKNTDLLAQKYDVLSRNIAATKQKIDTLKEAQRQMGDYNSLTEEQKSNYNALTTEIAKAENQLEKMNNELKNSSKVDLSKLTNALKKVGDVAVQVAKKIAQVTAAIGGALAGIVTLGVKSYAELEQNLGGVETLFGKSADKVIANAKKAYATAGVSANEYMKGVTSFSASLLQSLGNNTDKAADIADMAFRDMSDNANKFGTDMQSIQNAYQGFSKQQYQLLDNLKLGYGGTKTEMQRLLKDAQKITGIKYDINNLADVYSAIHVIQQELGVTGTTAEEAEKTISGSVQSMKAAFDNFLNGSGSPEDLANALANVFTNIGTAITKLLPSIVTGLNTLAKNLLPLIGDMLWEMLPQLLDELGKLIQSICTAISNNTEEIRQTVTMIINEIVNFITTNLPIIIQAGIDLIIALAQGIGDALSEPDFIQSIVDCVLKIVEIITDNLDLIIDVSLEIILALTDGIIASLPQLADKIPLITDKICDVILNNLDPIIEAALYIILTLGKAIIQYLPQIMKNTWLIPRRICEWLLQKGQDIFNAGIDLLKQLINGFINKVTDFKDKTKEIITKLKNWLLEGIGIIKDVGKELINGLWNGIQEKWNGLKNKVNSFGEGIVGKFKKVFGVSSPSKVFKKELGYWLAKGVEVGFTDEMENATKNMTSAIPVNQLATNVSSALRSLNAGIENSINPTINPSVTYESNYVMMAKIFKEVLGDMKVELDDREMGKFIDKTVVNEVFN